MIRKILFGWRVVAIALVLVAAFAATSADGEARPISPSALAKWCEDKGGSYVPAWEDDGLLAYYACVFDGGIIDCDYGGQCDFYPAAAGSYRTFSAPAHTSPATDAQHASAYASVWDER